MIDEFSRKAGVGRLPCSLGGKDNMTKEDQIRAIQALGYSQPEAQFLRLVALHSGYFVRRQFVRFTESARGKRAQDFIDRLIARGHVRREVFREDRHLFRLQSKASYEALGQDDNRNRREHQPSTVRLRLMGLDLVLDRPEYQFVSTEQQRLEYFFEQRGIHAEALPARLFSSNGTLTTRYFPDGFPQFLRDDNPLAVSFVYVDDAQLTTDAFRAYLCNYKSLFERLGKLDLLLLTTVPARFTLAQSVLERFRLRVWESRAPAVDLNRLLAHFPHRLLYETRATRTLNTAEIHALAEDMHTLCGPQIDHLYAIWKQDGAEALRAEWAAQQPPAPPQINLIASVLKYDYDLFGTLHAAS
jgi:hypothetical protein